MLDISIPHKIKNLDRGGVYVIINREDNSSKEKVRMEKEKEEQKH